MRYDRCAGLGLWQLDLRPAHDLPHACMHAHMCGSSISDQHKTSRTAVEKWFLTNAMSFFVGWMWISLLRDLSTLLARWVNVPCNLYHAPCNMYPVPVPCLARAAHPRKRPPTILLAYLLACSPICLPTEALTHLSTCSLSNSPTNSLTRPPTHLFTHQLTCTPSPTRPPTHLLTHLLTFTHSRTNLLAELLAGMLVDPLTDSLARL